MNVPMADLRAQHRRIRAEIDAAIGEVLDKGSYILGENVSLLEKEIAAYTGVRHGLGVASGTDALLLAMAALDIGEGDEVVTTAFTFVATIEMITALRAVPVFADIDPVTFNLDPSSLAAKITPRTKAIIPVHLYGQVADMKAVGETARKHSLFIIEDAAQAIGASLNGRRAGAFGHAAALSFYPTKNLGGCGDGGMVLTDDEYIAERVRLLRFHGSGGTYLYRYRGFNSRLDEMQAAILRVKMRYLDLWNERRRANAALYRDLLADIDPAILSLPAEAPGGQHIYHQFTLRCARRDDLKAYLQSQGSGSAVFYPLPLHLQDAYRYLGCREGDFPESERAAREVLSIPVYPEMERSQVEAVAQAIRRFAKGE
ncbi:MAG: DegT/DnrJ/EryC1/StrS family aminotransferase [Armatimonadetes bacterium]|nr:DegT/DnrJ/EryC1/StrS family aminotransferase [Armatimonadota bacterium]